MSDFRIALIFVIFTPESHYGQATLGQKSKLIELILGVQFPAKGPYAYCMLSLILRKKNCLSQAKIFFWGQPFGPFVSPNKDIFKFLLFQVLEKLFRKFVNFCIYAFGPRWNSLRSQPFQGPKKSGFPGTTPCNAPRNGSCPFKCLSLNMQQIAIR